MNALPAQWIEEALARARAEAAEVRPFIAAPRPRPLPAMCFTWAENREEQQEDGHRVGTRWATMINTLTATPSAAVSSTSSGISAAPMVIVAGTFHAALPQPEVGTHASDGIVEYLNFIPENEKWIPPNARPRRKPL